MSAESKRHLLATVPNVAKCCALEAASRNKLYVTLTSRAEARVMSCHVSVKPSVSCSTPFRTSTIFPLNHGPKLGRVQPSDACKLYYCYRLFSYLCKSYLPYGSEGPWLRYSPPELSTRILWAKTQHISCRKGVANGMTSLIIVAIFCWIATVRCMVT